MNVHHRRSEQNAGQARRRAFGPESRTGGQARRCLSGVAAMLWSVASACPAASYALPSTTAPAALASPSMTSFPTHIHSQTSVSQPMHDLTAEDLRAWLDGMLPAALKQGDVPGAVVSVVKGGRVLLTAGYGLSDVAVRIPMDPERTLVRPGSISKLFTWTAIMQLAEAGKLDLDADVNRYLDFKVPEPFGRPITLNELMTHRGGFEEGLKDAVVTRPDLLEPLGVFLKRHIRPALYPPGEVPAYSNYGTALAGYIVERVSGERFEDYVAHHIFTPLGMTRSTFSQPLPALTDSVVSRAYMNGTQPPGPFELISFAPAGALTTTADDMTRFMLAHLQDGQTNGAKILRPETVRLMHSPSIASPPGFDVMAHGFFHDERNGRLLLEHGGDTILFHSHLMLLPKEQVGLFVSLNSRGRGDAAYGIRQRLLDAFLDRYFPGPDPSIDAPTMPTARADAAKIAGRYESSRRVQSGFMSLFYVLQGQETLTVLPDGDVTLSSSPGKSFRETEPGRWREVGGERVLTSGVIDGVASLRDSRDPVGVLQRTPLLRNAAVNGLVFLLSLAALLTAAAAWAIGAGARLVYRQPAALAERERLVQQLARIFVVADLVYLVAWSQVLGPILGQQVWFYTSALDPVVRAMEIAAIVPLCGAAAGFANASLALISQRGWAMKAGAVAGAAALVGVPWIAFVGGLMSLTLNY